jgi:hypothetical protein
MYSEMVTLSPETVQSRALTGAGCPMLAVLGCEGVGTQPSGASLVAISCAVSLGAPEPFAPVEGGLEDPVVEDPEPAVLLLLLPQAAMASMAIVARVTFKGRHFMRRW